MFGASIKCVVCFAVLSLNVAAAPQVASFSFYSENISLKYEKSIFAETHIEVSEEAIVAFYNTLEELPYRPLLHQFLRYRKKFELNTYLYYELINTSVEQIFTEKDKNYKTLIKWYLLAKSGMDVRLTHYAQQIYLYAYTNESIYDVPIIQLGNKEFINLTDLRTNNPNPGVSFFVVEFVPNPDGQAMSFKLTKLPKFKSNPITKKIVFAHRNEVYRIEIEVDKTLIDLMHSYPLTNPFFYIETPLSASIEQSLLPKLRALLKNKTQQEAIKFLLSLTRTAFKYKTDVNNFGRNKPMIPDEVLFYTHSDCEDRSALFYALAKELVGAPIIVVDYPEHLTVGVALEHNIGKPLYHNGKRYTICDPTGPSNSDEIGIYPKGYEQLPYTVGLSFK